MSSTEQFKTYSPTRLDNIKVSPEDGIGGVGLYIGRGTDVAFRDDLRDATEDRRDVFHQRDRFVLNLLKREETRDQSPIGHIGHGEAQKAIKAKVPSLWLPMDVKVEGIGLIPIKGDLGSIVIVDLLPESQEKIIEERLQIIEVLESFAPDSVFTWMKFTKPGIPLGAVRPHNTQEQRNWVRSTIRSCVKGNLRLHPAKVRPKIAWGK